MKTSYRITNGKITFIFDYDLIANINKNCVKKIKRTFKIMSV